MNLDSPVGFGLVHAMLGHDEAFRLVHQLSRLQPHFEIRDLAGQLKILLEAATCHFNSWRQVAWFERLDEITERPRRRCAIHQLSIPVGRQQNRRRDLFFRDDPNRLDAIEIRHFDIKYADIWAEFSGHIHRRFSISGFGHNLVAHVLQHLLEVEQDDWVVVGDEHAHGFSVPALGRLRALDRPHLAVIIPAYNEASRIVPTLNRVNEYFEAQDYSWSVTVVSDGSKDGTNDLVQEFCKGNAHFSLMALNPNRGKGHAVRRGMLDVDGDFILFSDADLAAPIEEIEKLMPKMADHDIAIGSRPLKESKLEIHQPWYREALGRFSNKLIQLMAVKGIQDTQCGFKVFRSEVAKDVFSRCKLNGFSFDFEALMIGRDLGYSIAEVPIRWAHQEGSKVVIWRDAPKALIDLFKLRLMGKARRLAKGS